MRKLFFILVMFVLLVTPMLVVAAQGEAPADWTNLSAVLVWLSGVGAVTAVGWIVANLLEKLAWWNNLPTPVKWGVPPILAVLVAFFAQLALTQELVLAKIQPYFGLVVLILLNYFGLQLGHIMTKKAKG